MIILRVEMSDIAFTAPVSMAAIEVKLKKLNPGKDSLFQAFR